MNTIALFSRLRLMNARELRADDFDLLHPFIGNMGGAGQAMRESVFRRPLMCFRRVLGHDTYRYGKTCVANAGKSRIRNIMIGRVLIELFLDIFRDAIGRIGRIGRI